MPYSEDQLRAQQVGGPGAMNPTLALIQNMENVSQMERDLARAKAHSDFLRGRLEQPAYGRSPLNIGRAVLDGLKYGYDRRQQEAAAKTMADAQRRNTDRIARAFMGQPPADAPNVIKQPDPDVIP